MKRVGMVALLVGLLAVVGGTSVAGAATSSKDQALLQAGVIRASDVPATWQASTQKDSGSNQFVGSGCKAIKAAYATAHNGPHKLSPQFVDPSNGGTTLAENVALVFKNAGAATKFMTPLGASNAPVCLQATLQKQLGKQGQVGAPAAISNLQGVGDQAVGYQATVTIPGQGSLVVDYLGVRVGRVATGFTFANRNTQIPNGPQIVNAVINRLAQAGA